MTQSISTDITNAHQGSTISPIYTGALLWGALSITATALEWLWKNLMCVNHAPVNPLTLLAESLAACKRVKTIATKHMIVVSVSDQKLHLFDSKKLVASYSVSTSKNGTGQLSGSYQTPLGLHQIKEKIGSGASPYAIFESRKNTGKLFSTTDTQERITTRILWLDGLEQGFNRGENQDKKVVDSYKRYIYIHGTNHTEQIGKPASIGCIRMAPEDVIKLYPKVPTKTLVYITA